METGVVAAVAAMLVLVLVEAFGRFYPTRETWWRLRRARGRGAVRRMRERFEAASQRRSATAVAVALVIIVAAWVPLARRLDRFWSEIALDVAPYVIAVAALLRIPVALARVGERMRDYERRAGEDPDSDLDGGGGEAVVEL